MEATSIAEGARGVPANMYAMPFSRAMEYGFVAHYNHTGDPATERHANNLSFTSEQLWWLATNPLSLQVHLNGWGGVGLDAAALPQLLPALLWAAMLVAVRFFFRREIARLGLYLQVVVPSSGPKRVDEGSGAKAARLSRGQRNKLRRFQTQVWLAVTYTASALFGYMVQRDELWFGLPLSEANRIHILSPHPYRPGRGLLLYYQYGLGFYLAECFLHLVDRDIKRSDFLEYLAHHVVTIALIVLSHCSYEHRFGVYVLFIHDVSDVMLAVSKALNYVVQAAEEREQRAARNGGRRTGPARGPGMPPVQARLQQHDGVHLLCRICCVVFLPASRLPADPRVGQRWACGEAAHVHSVLLGFGVSPAGGAAGAASVLVFADCEAGGPNDFWRPAHGHPLRRRGGGRRGKSEGVSGRNGGRKDAVECVLVGSCLPLCGFHDGWFFFLCWLAS
ncbi:hypothetical protein TRSC58_01903 [Trypanosoma rangeli SC58]|uniref:TLC domain-containing protein n=1 Tax=Trypanosoma rangeli SC58 TaxID=429131 RepID=A0A061J8A4_TRYRA|nr:hypothetical protein TRSC58_01903 [Trypanosoma rangeli SC58]